MLHLIQKFGRRAFTLLASAGIVAVAVVLVSLLDLLLKGSILPLDQLIGGLVALAIGPVVVLLLLRLTRRLAEAQRELEVAHQKIKSEAESLRVLSQELTAANRKLDFAQRVAKVGYYEFDIRAGTYTCSSELDRIFGVEPQMPHDFSRWEERVHPDDRARYREHLDNCLKQRQGFSLDYRIIREGDRRQRWVYVWGRLLHDDTTPMPAKLIGIVQDITDRKADENELRETRDRLRLATEAARFGVWDWDLLRGQIRFTPRVAEFFGWPLQDAEGGTADQILWESAIHPDDLEPFRRAFQHALDAGDNAYSIGYRIVVPGPATRFLRSSAYIRRDQAGEPIRVIGLLQDQTEMREAERALAQACDRAEASNRAKSDFVANMSHEIRTPLNAVMGMTHLLRLTPLNREQQDYLETIVTAGRSLLGVLNDILDFSKIEAGRLDVSPTVFCLPDLLSEVAAVLSVSVGDKPVEILIGMADEIHPYLLGDMLRLRQVLVNLAGNAVKFTESGEVTVWAEIESRTDPTVTLRFRVRDTGIGMTPEQLGSLFMPFFQADASVTRRFGGTGLGLAICKHLLELMGGTIEVDSEFGAGSTFSFSIPLRISTDPSATDISLEKAKERLRGLSVLVVDDHPTARAFIKNTAEHLGWTVDTASSGREAIECFRRRSRQAEAYDLALIDWKMPGLDGVQTSAAIRQQCSGGGGPIILLVTAHVSDEIVSTDAARTVDGVLFKPLTCQSLLKKVAELRDRESRQPGTPPIAADVAESFPLLGARLLLVEDNAVNQTVAQRILERAGAKVDVAEDGRQAVDRMATSSAEPYDLVLMDVQMPVMDGLTATRLIREQLQMDIPIIAMSAGVLQSEKDRCIASGMDGFIGKPFNVPELIALIQRHRRKPRMGIAPPGDGVGVVTAGPYAADLPALPGFDLVDTLRRFGHDRALLESILVVFRDEFQDLPAMLDGFLMQGDMDALRSLLHKFRGSASSLGAYELAKLAGDAESLVSSGEPCSTAVQALAAQWRVVLPCLAGEFTVAFDAEPAGVGNLGERYLPWIAEKPGPC